MKNPFTGTGVALITPFRKQDTIDFSKLEALINYNLNNGVDAVIEFIQYVDSDPSSFIQGKKKQNDN